MGRVQKNLLETSGIPENAKDELKKRNVKLGIGYAGKRKKGKYKKEVFIRIYEGYDMLENLLIVRSYIQKKYNIDNKLLELLLHIAPKHFFTQEDYRLMVKPFKYSRIRILLESGYVKLITNGKNKGKNLYSISPAGKRLIVDFYECLSGEKPIPVDSKSNPMARLDANAYDKKKMETIRKLNQLTPSPRKKLLFE